MVSESNLRNAKRAREVTTEENDDLEALLSVFPEPIQVALRVANKSQDLLEVVMDLGRIPQARFHRARDCVERSRDHPQGHRRCGLADQSI